MVYRRVIVGFWIGLGMLCTLGGEAARAQVPANGFGQTSGYSTPAPAPVYRAGYAPNVQPAAPCATCQQPLASPCASCPNPMAAPCATCPNQPVPYRAYAVPATVPAGSCLRPAYRTEYQKVPVTVFRPVTINNPQNGCPVTCMKPCTTYMWQARRVPTTQSDWGCLDITRWFRREPAAPVYPPGIAPSGYPLAPGNNGCNVCVPCNPCANPCGPCSNPCTGTGDSYYTSGAATGVNVLPGTAMPGPVTSGGSPVSLGGESAPPAVLQPGAANPIAPETVPGGTSGGAVRSNNGGYPNSGMGQGPAAVTEDANANRTPALRQIPATQNPPADEPITIPQPNMNRIPPPNPNRSGTGPLSLDRQSLEKPATPEISPATGGPGISPLPDPESSSHQEAAPDVQPAQPDKPEIPALLNPHDRTAQRDPEAFTRFTPASWIEPGPDRLPSVENEAPPAEPTGENRWDDSVWRAEF